jgi:hypothetical protein
MNFRLTGIGIWGPGLSSWNDVRTLVASDADTLPDPFEAPRPDAIPARERRRAGLTINLAVEVMHQACAMSGVSTDRVATVFASAMGDTDVTDYMCRKLAGEERHTPARSCRNGKQCPARNTSSSRPTSSPAGPRRRHKLLI